MSDTERINALEKWLKSNPTWPYVQIYIPKDGGCYVQGCTWTEHNVRPSWTRPTLRDAIDAVMKDTNE